MIDIDEFLPRSEIDDLYPARPYYIVPDGKVGHDGFAAIRETIRLARYCRDRTRGSRQPRTRHGVRGAR